MGFVDLALEFFTLRFICKSYIGFVDLALVI